MFKLLIISCNIHLDISLNSTLHTLKYRGLNVDTSIVMCLLRYCNLCGGVAYTCCFRYPDMKRPVESNQLNMETFL